MIRNLTKALLLFATLGSIVASACAQGNPQPLPPPTTNNQDWVIYCWNPLVTKDPYSTDWGAEWQYDSLFGAVQGVSGTVTFDTCFPTVVTLPMAGRLGFFVGVDTAQTLPNGQPNPDYLIGGSIQDNLAGTPVDDGLGLTWGSYTGVSGNFSIAKLMVGSTTSTTVTSAYFGSAAIDTAYFGASDRYFVCESTMLNFRVSCRVDVIGDAARVQWTLTNTQTTVAPTVGLWFGQWVYMFGPQGIHSADYVTAPGLVPMNVDSSFAAIPNTAASPPQLALPPYVDYGMYQSWAYGLQIVLQPTPQIPDQTPCDSIDIGKNGFLLGSMTASDGAMPDVLLPDTYFDYEGSGEDAYIQKWNPAAVGESGSGTSATRTIVAYYRSTWSTSDYAKPYSV